MTQIIEVIGWAILVAFATSFIYYGISTIRKEIKAHSENKRMIQAIKEVTNLLNKYKL
jgi:Holliday junction resolvasome RuvABC endonuclease subunit